MKSNQYNGCELFPVKARLQPIGSLVTISLPHYFLMGHKQLCLFSPTIKFEEWRFSLSPKTGLHLTKQTTSQASNAMVKPPSRTRRKSQPIALQVWLVCWVGCLVCCIKRLVNPVFKKMSLAFSWVCPGRVSVILASSSLASSGDGVSYLGILMRTRALYLGKRQEAQIKRRPARIWRTIDRVIAIIIIIIMAMMTRMMMVMVIL